MYYFLKDPFNFGLFLQLTLAKTSKRETVIECVRCKRPHNLKKKKKVGVS